MERLKHLERERVRLEFEGERQMQRFQREKDLDTRHKRHERSPIRHKPKRSRYPGEEGGHHSRERHRKREARIHKDISEGLYKSSPSSPTFKEDKKTRDDIYNSDDSSDVKQKMPKTSSASKMNNITRGGDEDAHMISIDDITEVYNRETDVYNTIEVNIRDEDEDDDDEDDDDDDDGGGGGGMVEEGELGVDNKEDDYVNPYKMAKSKFDEDEEEEDEEEGGEVVIPNTDKQRENDAVNSIRKSDRSDVGEDKEDSANEEGEVITEAKKDDEMVKEVGGKVSTPPSPPSPKSPPNPDSPSTNLPPFYPAIQGCRNVEEFHCLNRVEEGTYGVVYRAVDRKTQEIVALKRLKMEKESEGFPITSLREINTLLTCTHDNVVKIREVVVGSNMDKIYLVMDFVEHDLKSLMEYMKEPFLIGEVKTLMMQLLKGVSHLHDNWVVHRDLKTSNLLLSNQGVLKIGDFGLAREYGSPLKPYTPIVVTLWYRSPELLLGQKVYSTPVDIWSVGCIFGELVLKKPLFPGRSELDQLNKIFRELGSPNEKIWPGVTSLPGFKTLCFNDHLFNKLAHKFDKHMSARGFDLMNLLLTYCPEKRLTADEALKHNFFTEVPIPVEPSMFPTWPSKSELRQGKFKIGRTPKAPSGGEAYAKLVAEEEKVSTGFMLKSSQKPTGFALRF